MFVFDKNVSNLIYEEYVPAVQAYHNVQHSRLSNVEGLRAWRQLRLWSILPQK